MALTVTHYRWKTERTAVTLDTVRSPADAADVAREILRGEAQEVFIALYLSTQNQVNGYSEITRGTLDASLVHAREVFRGAILANAAAIIIAHNHPSGVVVPSAEDNAVTRQMVAAGKVIGIEVLDHIIVGNHFYSYSLNGML